MKQVRKNIKAYGCIIFFLAFLFWGSITTIASETNRRSFLNFPRVLKDADVVLVGKLVSIPPPYYAIGLEFYRIEVEEVLMGNVKENNLLIIATNLDTSEGNPAVLEPEFAYLLSLKEVDIGSEELSGKFGTFNLIRNWKGAVSLDMKAIERRALDCIEQQSGVSGPSVPNMFLDAVKFAISKHFQKNSAEPESLSEGVRAIYNAMGLSASCQ